MHLFKEPLGEKFPFWIPFALSGTVLVEPGYEVRFFLVAPSNIVHVFAWFSFSKLEDLVVLKVFGELLSKLDEPRFLLLLNTFIHEFESRLLDYVGIPLFVHLPLRISARLQVL